MKKLSAAVLASTIIGTATAASAGAYDPTPKTLTVQCWNTRMILNMVESKTYRVARYYKAGFHGGSGHIAELIDPKENRMMFFVFEGDLACLTAVVTPEPDDLKRAGLI